MSCSLFWVLQKDSKFKVSKVSEFGSIQKEEESVFTLIMINRSLTKAGRR